MKLNRTLKELMRDVLNAHDRIQDVITVIVCYQVCAQLCEALLKGRRG
jgi:hypothetical protein